MDRRLVEDEGVGSLGEGECKAAMVVNCNHGWGKKMVRDRQTQRTKRRLEQGLGNREAMARVSNNSHISINMFPNKLDRF